MQEVRAVAARPVSELGARVAALDRPPLKCVQDLVEVWAERTPEAVAVAAANGSMNYRELDSRANQLARCLRDLGVGPGQLVGVCVQRSLEQVVALLAILKARGAYVPLDPKYPAERLEFMLSDAQARVVLGQKDLVGKLVGGQSRILGIDSDWPWIRSQSAAPLADRATLDDLAYVIYTSGSTGRPKGVQVGHDNLLNLVSWHQQAFGVTCGDRATQVAGPSFDAAVWELWPYLTAGASVHQPDEDARLLPELLRDWLVAQRISVSFLPTALAEAVLALDWPPETALRFLLTGADSLHRYPRAELPFALINNYGPTECTVVATSGCVPSANGQTRPPSIGRPIANVQVHILDTAGQPVPSGITGELHIGGAGVARGYLRRPEQTAERFVANPFSEEPRARLYRTGDLACYRPDGDIEFQGRMDQQVKLRGYRVELGEIEAVLDQHPLVTACVVAVREDESGDRHLVAYVLPIQAASLPPSGALREFLARQLPDYMLPAVFVRLERLPLTPNGKVDRGALPEPNASNAWPSGEITTPRTWLEQRVMTIVAGLLSLTSDEVGLNDNFFELGGHSLLGTQLITRLREDFGVELPLRNLFDAPTVAGLSAEVQRLQPNTTAAVGRPIGWSPLVTIQPGGRRPPLFIVHQFGGSAEGYAELARQLGPEQPVYGFQALGVDDERSPDDQVTVMAARYVAALRIVQPRGPYRLGGHCFGGMVAFEMACQLQAHGDRVALLAIFEGFAPRRLGVVNRWWTPNALACTARNLPMWVDEIAHCERRELLPRLRQMGRRASGYLRPLKGRFELYDAVDDLSHVSGRTQVLMSAQLEASLRYVPPVYPGPITLFRVAKQPLLRAYDPLKGWAALSSRPVVTRIVPGTHTSMLAKPNVQSLARQLLDCLAVAPQD